MKLYELASSYNTILDAEDMSDEQIVEHLDNIQAQFKDKAISIGKVVLSLKAEAKGVEAELNRLAQRKRSLEHKAEWLESYLLDNMIMAKQDKIEGDVFNVSVKTNPPSVTITDDTLIPSTFKKLIPESWQTLKTDILKHFKDTGEIIAGVEIVKDKKRVEIR